VAKATKNKKSKEGRHVGLDFYDLLIEAISLIDFDCERKRDVTPPARGLLPLPHVQFWETENSWRLDSSYRGGHRRDIPCLVDASDVRTVNALKTLRRGQ
jgi:hypothetical protein